MAKKIDYASMYTLRKDGRYMGYYKNAKGERVPVYNRDPEKLFFKIEVLEKPKEPTFQEIAEAWHDSRWETMKGGTKACYAARYNEIVKEQTGKNAVDVTAPDIYKHLQRLAKKEISAKVIKTTRSIYKLIFQYAINDDIFGKYITNNPAINVPMPTNVKPSVKRDAPEEEIVIKIRKRAKTAYFGLFAMLLICTGFRRGEALALTWGDIDFKNKTISCSKSLSYRGSAKIGATKTAAGIRTVPLLADLEKVLKKPKSAKLTDYVFVGETGGRLSEAAYKRHWMHYCKDMGFVTVEKSETRKSAQGKEYVYTEYKAALTPHVLRHGYATMLYDAGVDVYTAQKLLGHANVETTIAIYTHLSKQKQQQSIDKLNEYIANGYKPALSEKLSTTGKTTDKSAF